MALKFDQQWFVKPDKPPEHQFWVGEVLPTEDWNIAYALQRLDISDTGVALRPQATKSLPLMADTFQDR